MDGIEPRVIIMVLPQKETDLVHCFFLVVVSHVYFY